MLVEEPVEEKAEHDSLLVNRQNPRYLQPFAITYG